MAPLPLTDTSSAPLAEWFFISGTYHARSCNAFADFSPGVDSQQLRWGKEEELANNTPQAPVEPTIEEDNLEETEGLSSEYMPPTPRNGKRNSYHRLSRLSDDARLSISSFSPVVERKGTDSNRSSTTIKGIQINGTSGLNDVDFERALRKFASERDSFLSDLTLSAGAVVPSRPKPRPKTQRIINEDSVGMKSGVGSIRRRISFRDMNSMKRQSSVARQGEFSILCAQYLILCIFSYKSSFDSLIAKFVASSFDSHIKATQQL